MTLAPHHLRLAAALTGLALAPVAPAEDPAPAPAPPTASAPPEVPSQPPQPPIAPPEGTARDVGLYLAVGYDFGFTRLVEVTFTDGSTQTMSANSGLALAAGATFLKLLDGRLGTRATVGLKYDSIRASNGSIRYLAFPIELVEVVNVLPLRFGAGLSLALGPRISGSGAASQIDASLDASLGLLLEAEYVWALGREGRGALVVGPRFLWQRLESKSTGVAVNANALGIGAGFEF